MINIFTFFLVVFLVVVFVLFSVEGFCTSIEKVKEGMYAIQIVAGEECLVNQ